MTSRRKSRELAFFALYQLEVAGYELEDLLEATIRAEDISVEARPWFRALIRTVWQDVALLDALIDEVATGWRVGRINKLDLSLLRLGTCELTMPVLGEIGEASIVINEAVELAKKYCGEESAKFINGILGKIATLEAPLELARDRVSASDTSAALKKFIPRSPNPLQERHKVLYPEGKPKPKPVERPAAFSSDRPRGAGGRPGGPGRPGGGSGRPGGGRPGGGRPGGGRPGGGRPGGGGGRPGGPKSGGPGRGGPRSGGH